MSDEILNPIKHGKIFLKDSKKESTSFRCPNFTYVDSQRNLIYLFLETFSSRYCTICFSSFYQLCRTTSEMLFKVNIHIALCMLESLTISVFQLLPHQNRVTDFTEYILSAEGKKGIL